MVAVSLIQVIGRLGRFVAAYKHMFVRPAGASCAKAECEQAECEQAECVQAVSRVRTWDTGNWGMVALILIQVRCTQGHLGCGQKKLGKARALVWPVCENRRQPFVALP